MLILLCEYCGRTFAPDEGLLPGDDCPADDCPSHDPDDVVDVYEEPQQ